MGTIANSSVFLPMELYGKYKQFSFVRNEVIFKTFLNESRSKSVFNSRIYLVIFFCTNVFVYKILSVGGEDNNM